MARIRQFSAAALVALCCMIPAAPAPAQSDGRDANASATDIEDALDTVYRDGRIQRDLPGAETPPELPDLSWLEPVLKVLGWLLLAALIIGFAVLAVLVLRRRFGAGPGRESVDLPEETARGATRLVKPEREPVLWGREALVEADRLAAAGDFAEAIHVLLIGGLADLRRRLARVLPPSLTSREILARIEMPQRARDALATMISMVELSRFGFRSVDSDDYTRCRERFLVFAEAEEAPA